MATWYGCNIFLDNCNYRESLYFSSNLGRTESTRSEIMLNEGHMHRLTPPKILHLLIDYETLLPALFDEINFEFSKIFQLSTLLFDYDYNPRTILIRMMIRNINLKSNKSSALHACPLYKIESKFSYHF